jgi:DNA modification methylase
MPEMPEGSVHTVVTSPPYWGLRDYGVPGQLGLESTPEEYAKALVDVFRGVWRVLRDDGTVWLNLGDSYAAQRGGTLMPAETLAGGEHGRSDSVAAYRGRPQRDIGERQDEARGDYLATAPVAHRNARAFGLKHKDLVGVPWRVAFALQADGWYLRSDIIWSKPNPMPESVTDRPTKSHEYLFLLSKNATYYYDHEAIKEPAVTGRWPGIGPQHATTRDRDEEYEPMEVHTTRNKRSVWTVPTRSYKGAHFATFPPELIRPCILAGSPRGGLVFDPFTGSGTTALVAIQEGRDFIGCELNAEYCTLADERLRGVTTRLF